MMGFYFDEHMNRKVADGLIERGYTIVMAVDVGMIGKDDDEEHLPYATEHGLILVTFDHPFAHRTLSKNNHLGLICLSPKVRTDVGHMIEILAEFAQTYIEEKDKGQVFWLP